MTNNDYIRIRCSEELKETAKRNAKEDNRTLASYIINLIEKDTKEKAAK